MFLPTLQVGPINRFDSFQRDLLRRRWDSSLFSLGLQHILFGYFKIFVLANYWVGETFPHFIDKSFVIESWWHQYLELVQSAIDIYLKFSGYCDIAIGFAFILGFRVGENFNFPFLATNISDFWRR